MIEVQGKGTSSQAKKEGRIVFYQKGKRAERKGKNRPSRRGKVRKTPQQIVPRRAPVVSEVGELVFRVRAGIVEASRIGAEETRRVGPLGQAMEGENHSIMRGAAR